MSNHGKDNATLKAALLAHGLVTETPSQIADCFRFGWNAALRSQAAGGEAVTPTAYLCECHDDSLNADERVAFVWGKAEADEYRENGYTVTPLYTHPAPSSDADITLPKDKP